MLPSFFNPAANLSSLRGEYQNSFKDLLSYNWKNKTLTFKQRNLLLTNVYVVYKLSY